MISRTAIINIKTGEERSVSTEDWHEQHPKDPCEATPDGFKPLMAYSQRELWELLKTFLPAKGLGS